MSNSFNHTSPVLQEALGGNPDFLAEDPQYALMLTSNPLDDGMADIHFMYSTEDIVDSFEGAIENHDLGTVDPATAFIMENEKHGRMLVMCSDAKLGMKWSVTFFVRL